MISKKSLLFVPGHIKKYQEKANYLKPGYFIIDFEDSVPKNLKIKSYELVKKI